MAGAHQRNGGRPRRGALPLPLPWACCPRWRPLARPSVNETRIDSIESTSCSDLLIEGNVISGSGTSGADRTHGIYLANAGMDQRTASVMDLGLPGMDGWEVLRRLKADPETEDIPVIMVTAAAEEIPALDEERERLETSINLLLLPKDPNDARDTILEIRSGTGGEEAALFAADLFRMYSRYAEAKGWKVEVLAISPSELGGIKEVIAGDMGAVAKIDDLHLGELTRVQLQDQ